MPVPQLPTPFGSINKLGWGSEEAGTLLQQLPAWCLEPMGQWAWVGSRRDRTAEEPWGRCFPAHREVRWIWEVGAEGTQG